MQRIVSIVPLHRKLRKLTVHPADSELEDCLFDFERARNTPGAPRHGRNKGSSNGKRRRTSTAPGSAKRRKQSTHSHVLIEDEDEDFELDIVDVFEGVKTELKGIRVDQLQDYYIFAFRSMSQLSNKDIAKTWIRAGHPKKQSKYPYNGGRRARQSLPAGHAYKGHFTKPDWWPSDLGWDHPDGARGCRHREPDHIKKLGTHTFHDLLSSYC